MVEVNGLENVYLWHSVPDIPKLVDWYGDREEGGVEREQGGS